MNNKWKIIHTIIINKKIHIVHYGKKFHIVYNNLIYEIIIQSKKIIIFLKILF